MTFTLSQLATELGVACKGDGELVITGVAPLDTASEGDISFLSNPKYLAQLDTTRASAVIVAPGVEREGLALLVGDNPYYIFARALTLFNPPAHPSRGVSPGAFISQEAFVSDSATVMAGATIETGATVGDNCVVYPGAYIGADVSVGRDCLLYPNVTVREGCILGERVILQPGCVIGSDGFGYAPGPTGHYKIPQVGIVVLEDDVEVGANTTVDRAAMERTVIGKGTKLDNLVQVAHNVVMGQHCVVAGQTGISGSTKIGNGVVIAGQAGVAGHITIGDRAVIGGQSAVASSVEPGARMSGISLMSHHQWLRTKSILTKLPEMRKTLLKFEKRIAELEEELKKR